ncbi:hypothetical protein TNCV_3694991 [Trichonephila clavipes]|nr:hypothetical protein TNCV_3694991 [Trichonephila clavipes]
MHAYMDRVFMQCFLNPFRCTQLYSKNRPRSNLPVFKSFGGKQATEDLANRRSQVGGMHAYMDRVFMQCFLNPFRCTQLYSEKQATKQLARLQELWWKQATEDLANEEAKWMYTVVLEKQATKQLARLQELWWKQATEDLANEEAKWVKLKDKKKLRTESAKGIEDSVLNRQKYNFYFVYRV